jgi:hypothetical protein
MFNTFDVSWRDSLFLCRPLATPPHRTDARAHDPACTQYINPSIHAAARRYSVGVCGAGVAKTTRRTSQVRRSFRPFPSPLSHPRAVLRCHVKNESAEAGTYSRCTPQGRAHLHLRPFRRRSNPSGVARSATWHLPHARPILRRESWLGRKSRDSSGECHVIASSTFSLPAGHQAAFPRPSRSFSTFPIFLAPARPFSTSSSSASHEIVPRRELLFTPASSSQAKLLRIVTTIDLFGTPPAKTAGGPRSCCLRTRSRSRRSTARSPFPTSGSVSETRSAASRPSRISSTSRLSCFH